MQMVELTPTVLRGFSKNERGVKKRQLDPLIKTASVQVEYRQEIKSSFLMNFPFKGKPVGNSASKL